MRMQFYHLVFGVFHTQKFDKIDFLDNVISQDLQMVGISNFVCKERVHVYFAQIFGIQISLPYLTTWQLCWDPSDD